MKALISGIKRMEIHDGDGLRTTVFFKGCPLKCVWCHNPESISFFKQLAYFKEKCIDCDNCILFCPDASVNKEHDIDYDYCKGCGICANECPSDAIEMVKE